MQFEDHCRTALHYPCQQYGVFSMKASQGTKLYCLVNRGTVGVNNLPRVVARIMPRSESNPRPLDYESKERPTATPPSWVIYCLAERVYGQGLH